MESTAYIVYDAECGTTCSFSSKETLVEYLNLVGLKCPSESEFTCDVVDIEEGVVMLVIKPNDLDAALLEARKMCVAE